MVEFINFYLIPGLVLGCIYALGAIGLSFTFGILRFANFAHGDTMTLGVYLTLTLTRLTTLHPFVVLPLAMALTGACATLIDRLFYKPFRHSPTVMLVIASFGMMLMIRSIVQFTWGVQLQPLQTGIQQPLIILDTIRLAPKHALIFAATATLVLAVHLLLTKSKIGKAMRAVADNPELAKITGIDTEKIIRTTWMLGGALATAAGVFLAIDTHIETLMGFKLLLPMFAAAILGGIGKPYGALLGGLVIGIAEEISSYPWIGETPLLPPGYKAGIAFAIMVIMLIWRPQGLLKGRSF